jgi:hypothetical protein
MEMALILYKKRRRHRKEIRVNKNFTGSIFLVTSVMLKYIILAYHKKAKIEHCSIHFIHKENKFQPPSWLETSRNVIQKRVFQYEPARIAILVALNVAMIFWLQNQKILTLGLSYNYAKGEAITESNIPLNMDGKEIDPQSFTKFGASGKQEDNKSEENKDLAQRLNEIISSDEEKCQKSKEEKECRELCLKNEEEIIAQMKEEERRAWLKYIYSKPKIRSNAGRVSCREKNDGDPSKSQTKGKHQDEDCCPDPDEWPKPGCTYSPRGIALMLSGPKQKK